MELEEKFMKINEETMKHGAELTHGSRYRWDDEEIKIALRTAKLTYAYLRVKGEKFHFAAMSIGRDIEMFEMFVESRK